MSSVLAAFCAVWGITSARAQSYEVTPDIARALRAGDAHRAGDLLDAQTRKCETATPVTEHCLDALLALAKVRSSASDMKGAEAAARRAVTGSEAAAPRGGMQRFYAFFGLAEILVDQKRDGQATTYYRRAIAVGETVQGLPEETLTLAMNNLALNLSRIGAYVESAQIARQVVDARRRILPPGHIDLAAPLGILSASLGLLGRAAEGELYAREVLAIVEQHDGLLSVSRAEAMNTLGKRVSQQGRYDEALVLYAAALKIYVAQRGERDLLSADTLENMAYVMTMQGRYGEALALLQRSLATHEALAREDDPTVATSLANLARNLALSGDCQSAMPLMKRALAIRLKAYGENNSDTAAVYIDLATCLAAMKQDRGAEDMFDRGVAANAASLVSVSPQRLSGEIALARFLVERGRRRADAIRLLRMVSAAIDARIAQYTGFDMAAQREFASYAPAHRLHVRTAWTLAHAAGTPG